MARSYANIATAIWRDDEFRALTVAEQHAYMLLTTQQDISAAGVLPLALTRWSSRSKNGTVADLRAALDGLEAHRFVIVDYDTEEVLVRSFVRWDNGHTNPKRRPVIRDAAGAAESVHIRRTLTYELNRLGIDGEAWTGTPAGGLPDTHRGSHADRQPDSHADSPSDSHTDSLSGVERRNGHRPETLQVDSLTDSHADSVSPSERVVVTKAVTATHNPHSALTPPPLRSGGAASARPRTPASAIENGPQPPPKCPKHEHDPTDPPCGACRAARERLETWRQTRAADAAAAQSTAARERAEAARLAIDACDLCDPAGYVETPAGPILCHHDPANAERTARGAAAVRALIGKGPQPRETPTEDDEVTAATKRNAAKRAARAAEPDTATPPQHAAGEEPST